MDMKNQIKMIEKKLGIKKSDLAGSKKAIEKGATQDKSGGPAK
jgi:hypothetical protein